MNRRLSAVILTALSAACGGDSEEPATPESPPSPAATEATETPTQAVAETATPEATPEPAAALPFAVEGLDGLACTGEWRNETFGSTGPFAATFHVEDGGGRVSLEIGGNAFGGAGGAVDAPFTVDGASTVFDVDLAFLGQAMFRFDGASPAEAVLDSPPALGPGSEVTLTEFSFDGQTLNAAVDIAFAGGSGNARSVLESTCG